MADALSPAAALHASWCCIGKRIRGTLCWKFFPIDRDAVCHTQIGAALVLGTLVAIMVVDKAGRRKLLIFGGMQMVPD